MKEKIRSVYTCDFCKKNYLRKHSCLHHEKYCSKNPINRHACFDCIHLDKGKTDEGYVSFTCTKLDKELHSFKAEKLKLSCLDHTERMPLTCSDHMDEVEKYLHYSGEF